MYTAHLCPHCGVRATFAEATAFQHPNGGPRAVIVLCQHCNRHVYGEGGSPDAWRFLYPAGKEEVPAAYPEEVRDDFTEALRSLQVGNYKSCVIMTRSALQAAMRDQNAKGANLKQEIEDLATRHIIPASLKDWAHEIRDGGNLVAHPELGKKVGKEDAEELLGLTESLLEYLYVIPKQVDERRRRLAQPP